MVGGPADFGERQGADSDFSSAITPIERAVGITVAAPKRENDIIASEEQHLRRQGSIVASIRADE
jgi:hypothetical protein